MAPPPRRHLFWQVYPTLLVSLILVAVLGAIVWHLFGVAPMGRGEGLSMHPSRAFHMRGLAMLLMVAAVVGLAAYPVVRRITRRLEALRLSVEAWGGGDLASRAETAGGDEIAAVAASFNAAADKADALLTAHKTLLAHASHELRSPLTRLGLAVEMFAGGGDPALAASVRREIAELDGLVEEILLASRLDHAPGLAETEWVDVLALAAEEAARAGAKLLDVTPGAAPFEVLGSPRLLRRLIRNLIDNAAKHGARPIEIALAHKAMAITLTVRDHGPGIPAALRDAVFEPFFRPDGWTEEAGSWGLGLSLVRQIAESHGGTALCEAAADGGAAFVIRLPARQ